MVFSTNKTDRQDITEILLNVAFSTMTLSLTLKIARSHKIQWPKRKKGKTDKQRSTKQYIKGLSNSKPTKNSRFIR
jgi:hypothetical protein